MKTPRFAQRFQYNENLSKWLWFVVETLVSAFVGILIALMFGDHYWAALIAFAILMLFLASLTVVLVLFENRVSVLSIMKQGLKDGKYEDVIKFGSAMRNTLFTSNKNADIVVLGAKIDEAASRIESAHYNRSKGDYLVTLDGKPRSITQIRIGLKIDDLGWSMHLSGRTEEAVTSILRGINDARHQATRLSRANTSQQNPAIAPLVQLILRGYRHLCGIHYEDVNQQRRATFYENATKTIMSHGAGPSPRGVCETKSGTPSGTTCGLFCGATYETKVACSRKNVLAFYFPAASQSGESPDFTAQLDVADLLPIAQPGLMSAADIQEDSRLYRALPSKSRDEILKEQCYAWSRNIVKRIQNGIHRQGETDFLADVELQSLVAEARAFSQVYYYGTGPVPLVDDFDSVLKQDILGKPELRYASLMAEIDLVKLLLPVAYSRKGGTESTRAMEVEQLITNLRATREICRDKRADLHVRASMHLITAHHLEYNLKYRYVPPNDVVDTAVEQRFQILGRYQKTVKELYREIIRFEHRVDVALQRKYDSVMEDLALAEKAMKKRFFVTSRVLEDPIAARFSQIKHADYQVHFYGNEVRSSVRADHPAEIKRIKAKWELG